MTRMVDWIYNQGKLIVEGELLRFSPQQAEIINLLLIAEGQISTAELYYHIHPEGDFDPLSARQISNVIGVINRKFAGIGWQVKRNGPQRWIECEVSA